MALAATILLVPVVFVAHVSIPAFCQSPANTYMSGLSSSKDSASVKKKTAANQATVSGINSEEVATIIGPINFHNAYDLVHLLTAFFGSIVLGFYGSPLLIPTIPIAAFFVGRTTGESFGKSILPTICMKSVDCLIGGMLYMALMPLACNGNDNVLHLIFWLNLAISAISDTIFMRSRSAKMVTPISSNHTRQMSLMVASNFCTAMVLVVLMKLFHMM